ncbi:MAG: hypothetical protein WC725_04675 [Patescibacteria group bacterium]|jgi:hypothetical protein
MLKKRNGTSFVELSIYIIILTLILTGSVAVIRNPTQIADDADLKNTLMVLDMALAKYQETHLKNLPENSDWKTKLTELKYIDDNLFDKYTNAGISFNYTKLIITGNVQKYTLSVTNKQGITLTSIGSYIP